MKKQIQYYLLAQSTAAFLYYGSMHMIWKSPNELPVTWIDELVGYDGFSPYIYLSFFFLVMTAILFSPGPVSKQCAYAIIFNALIAASVFVIFPTKIPDQYYHFDQLTSESIMKWIRNGDENLNCFPSMHIANAMTAVYFLNYRKRSVIRLITWCWFVLICYSVMSTKQHGFYDILGGAVLSMSGILFIKRSGKFLQNRALTSLQRYLLVVLTVIMLAGEYLVAGCNLV